MILFIGMTAILDFLVTYQRINIDSTIKGEALRIAETKLEYLRNLDPNLLNPGLASPAAEVRTIRRIPVTFNITWTIENVSTTGNRAVEVQVSWVLRGRTLQVKEQSIINTNV